MKAKNLIFITLVFFIIIIGVLATIFLLASQPVIITDKTPISTPVSVPGETLISIDQGNVNNFDIALINADDTIDLKNTQGERIPIQLDKNSWKNLNWSPDGKLLSVLGKTGDNIFDLFVFNLSTKSWRQATKFSQTDVGIDSYLWRDSNVILFTQGSSGEHWIHQYVYTSGEIIKLNKTGGKLYAMAPDAKSMVIKLNENNDTTSYGFFKTDGTLIYNLSKVSDTTTNLPIQIRSVTYTKSSDNIVLESSNNKLYKHIFGNSNAIEITNGADVTPLCGVNEKVILGLKQTITQGDTPFYTFSLETISTDNANSVKIASIDDAQGKLDFSKTKCYKVNNIALSLDDKWYLAKDQNFFDFFAVKSAKEVSFKTITD